MEISRAWAHDSNHVSHLTISHLKVLKKFPVDGWCGVESYYSVSSLSKKESREREMELDNILCFHIFCSFSRGLKGRIWWYQQNHIQKNVVHLFSLWCGPNRWHEMSQLVFQQILNPFQAMIEGNESWFLIGWEYSKADIMHKIKQDSVFSNLWFFWEQFWISAWNGIWHDLWHFLAKKTRGFIFVPCWFKQG